jgi:hypothetical protein
VRRLHQSSGAVGDGAQRGKEPEHGDVDLDLHITKLTFCGSIDMFYDDAARQAFAEWMNQGPSAPTNGDLVKHDKIDVELLEHLAAYMYRAGIESVQTDEKPRR